MDQIQRDRLKEATREFEPADYPQHFDGRMDRLLKRGRLRWRALPIDWIGAMAGLIGGIALLCFSRSYRNDTTMFILGLAMLFVALFFTWRLRPEPIEPMD